VAERGAEERATDDATGHTRGDISRAPSVSSVPELADENTCGAAADDESHQRAVLGAGAPPSFLYGCASRHDQETEQSERHQVPVWHFSLLAAEE
jgi:hypothetical protein